LYDSAAGVEGAVFGIGIGNVSTTTRVPNSGRTNPYLCAF
jgi:hypothetical protein